MERTKQTEHDVKGLKPPLQIHLDSGDEVNWGRSRQHCSESNHAPTDSRNCGRASQESVHGLRRRRQEKEERAPTERSIHEFAAIRRTTGMSCFCSDEWWRGVRKRDSRRDKRRAIPASDNFRRAHAKRRLSATRRHIQAMRADQQLTHIWRVDLPPECLQSLSNNGFRVKSSNAARWWATRKLRFPSSETVIISPNNSNLLTLRAEKVSFIGSVTEYTVQRRLKGCCHNISSKVNAVWTIVTPYWTRRWHSIECKLTPATRSPEICFCTLWPCNLDL